MVLPICQEPLSLISEYNPKALRKIATPQRLPRIHASVKHRQNLFTSHSEQTIDNRNDDWDSKYRPTTSANRVRIVGLTNRVGQDNRIDAASGCGSQARAEVARFFGSIEHQNSARLRELQLL